MTADLDPVLRRQLRRLGLTRDAPPSAEHWRAFLDAVNGSYTGTRHDRYLMQRSVQLASEEMQELYAALERQAEGRVSAERDHLQAILSSISDGYADLDGDGLIVQINPAGAEMLGGEAVGMRLADLLILGPDVRSRFPDLAAVYAHLNAGESLLDEGAELRVGDRTVQVSALLFPVRMSGEIDGYGFTFRDIGQRIERERAIRQMAKAMDASADAIYITDAEGVIQYTNRAFSAVTGLLPQEAIGANPRILGSGRTPPSVYQQMWGTLLAGGNWSGRLRNRRMLRNDRGDLEGFEDYWAQSTVTPYYTESGVLEGFVAVQRDVSTEVIREQEHVADAVAARLRAEMAALLQTQQPLAERLGAVLRQMSGSLSEWRGEPMGVGLRLRGLPETDDWESLHAGPLLRGWQQCVDGLSLPSGVRSRIVTCQASEGQARQPLLVVPLDSVRGPSGCLVIASGGDLELPRNVIESCELVAEMIGLAVADSLAWAAAREARTAAQEATEAKSNFLATMSHEIRTPMNGVIGMMDMLAQTDLDATQADYLNVARTSAESLLSIINDILDFSKIEAGKIHIERIPFDVRAMTEEVVTLFSSATWRNGVELSCFIPTDVPNGVRGDPTRLRQVLSNIVGNAVKFTEKGRVAVRVDRLCQEAGEMTLRFEVADTGIGMTRATVDRLFQPFSQADGSTTRRFGGTGLGLAISRQLVELMGGRLQLDSEPGVGTRFWIDLPLELAPEAGGSREVLSFCAGRRVLVVDDSEANRTVLSHYLRNWNLRIDKAANGGEALEYLAEGRRRGRPYWLVFLDTRVPGLDGARVLGELREAERRDSTTLVLLSPLGDSTLSAEATGFSHGLSKPVRQTHLDTLLAELVQQREPEGPAEQDQVALTGRVLVAEDNPVNQRVAEHLLKSMGLEVLVVFDGAQALEVLRAQPVDLVLMDCRMPVMDGFEATRTLRLEPGEISRVPVVALTAGATVEERSACEAAGMDDFVSKPIDRDALAAVLSRWLPN